MRATAEVINGDNEPDIKHEEAGAPDYEGYRIADYFSSLETNNVNQRVRSDGWWNKLTMTHGCYWKKCSFYARGSWPVAIAWDPDTWCSHSAPIVSAAAAYKNCRATWTTRHNTTTGQLRFTRGDRAARGRGGPGSGA